MHRLADDNEDNAPFQINYLDLGVQAKQFHRTEPSGDWRALSLGVCILQTPKERGYLQPTGGSGKRLVCAVAVWLVPQVQVVDLEWGVVLVIVSQSVHKIYKSFLIMDTDKTQLGFVSDK